MAVFNACAGGALGQFKRGFLFTGSRSLGYDACGRRRPHVFVVRFVSQFALLSLR